MKDYILVKQYPGMSYPVGTIFKYHEAELNDGTFHLSTEWETSYFEFGDGEFFIEYIKKSSIPKLVREYAIGQAIFEEIAMYNDSNLRKMIHDMMEHESDELQNTANTAIIKRTIENNKTIKIEFVNYDSIIISWSGISIKPEHGNHRKIYTFDKHFKI